MNRRTFLPLLATIPLALATITAARSGRKLRRVNILRVGMKPNNFIHDQPFSAIEPHDVIQVVSDDDDSVNGTWWHVDRVGTMDNGEVSLEVREIKDPAVHS